MNRGRGVDVVQPEVFIDGDAAGGGVGVFGRGATAGCKEKSVSEISALKRKNQINLFDPFPLPLSLSLKKNPPSPLISGTKARHIPIPSRQRKTLRIINHQRKQPVRIKDKDGDVRVFVAQIVGDPVEAHVEVADDVGFFLG